MKQAHHNPSAGLVPQHSSASRRDRTWHSQGFKGWLNRTGQDLLLPITERLPQPLRSEGSGLFSCSLDIGLPIWCFPSSCVITSCPLREQGTMTCLKPHLCSVWRAAWSPQNWGKGQLAALVLKDSKERGHFSGFSFPAISLEVKFATLTPTWLSSWICLK